MIPIQLADDGVNLVVDKFGRPIIRVWVNPANSRTVIDVFDYGATNPQSNLYGGAFMVFHAMNEAGQMLPAVTLNPGFIGGVPGRENGDFDVVFPVDGVSKTIALSGHWTDPRTGTVYPAGIQISDTNLFELGSSSTKWKKLNVA